MKGRLAVMVALAAVMCGGTSTSVSGFVNDVTMVARSASAIVTPGKDATPPRAIVVVSDQPSIMCGFASPQASTTSLVFDIANGGHPTFDPGTYPIGGYTDTTRALVPSGYVTFTQTTDTCKLDVPPSERSTTGTLVVKEVSSDRITGLFIVSFDGHGKLEGSFEAVVCAGVTSYDESKCQP